MIEADIGSNSRVFFVTGERTAIVDAGNPGSEWKILKALKVAGIPREQVGLRALEAALAVPVLAG